MDAELQRFKNANRDATDFNYWMIARSRDCAVRNSWDNVSGRAKLFRFAQGQAASPKSPYQPIRIRKSQRSELQSGLQRTSQLREPIFRTDDLLPKMIKKTHSFSRRIKASAHKPSRRSTQDPTFCLQIQRKNLSQLIKIKKTFRKLVKQTSNTKKQVLRLEVQATHSKQASRQQLKEFESFEIGQLTEEP